MRRIDRISGVVCFVAPLLMQMMAITEVGAFQGPRSVTRRSSLLTVVRDPTTNIFDADKAEAELRHRESLEKRREGLAGADRVTDHEEWKFFDTARINVSGGDGGNGCVAFRREKCEARGGPNGGRGGRGGNVVLRCNSGLNTLAPLRQKVHIRAIKGRNGIGHGKDGAHGKDMYIDVPPGTLVRDLKTQKLAGELREHGQELLVARGGRGGRGNKAFMTDRNTAPKLAERGEPGAQRWLNVELRLLADVGFLGVPNAGKSTLLAAASAARPKIANYPFTTIVPNLGVCDLGDEGAGLVMCDIPGLIEGASSGAGLGPAFLRHVQRCKVLLHVVDGTSEDPIGDFEAINKELAQYDELLSSKPQVVVLNKIDVSEVQEKQDELMAKLKEAAGHSRVLAISAATTERVKELMGRLKKFVDAQPKELDLPPATEIDLSLHALDNDSDDFEIVTDPAYPGQFRIKGAYIEQVAIMTHWEYPEAVDRFGRILDAIGISDAMQQVGAQDGDLVMVGEYDFEFAPGMTNVYIPPELLEKDASMDGVDVDEPEQTEWRPFLSGGYLDEDEEELLGFGDEDDWDLLDSTETNMFQGDEVFDGQFDEEFDEFDEFDEQFDFDKEEEVWTS